MSALFWIVPGLLLMGAGVLWLLRLAGSPCEGCGQPVMDCRCEYHPDPVPLLAADADPVQVAAAAHAADVAATRAAGHTETPDEWEIRLGNRLTEPRKEAP